MKWAQSRICSQISEETQIKKVEQNNQKENFKFRMGNKREREKQTKKGKEVP